MKPVEDDPVLASCREACARKGIWMHLGSLAVASDGGKFREALEHFDHASSEWDLARQGMAAG